MKRLLIPALIILMTLFACSQIAPESKQTTTPTPNQTTPETTTTSIPTDYTYEIKSYKELTFEIRDYWEYKELDGGGFAVMFDGDDAYIIVTATDLTDEERDRIADDQKKRTFLNAYVTLNLSGLGTKIEDKEVVDFDGYYGIFGYCMVENSDRTYEGCVTYFVTDTTVYGIINLTNNELSAEQIALYKERLSFVERLDMSL